MRALEWQRDATTRRSARTVGERRRRVLGLAECLLFGRAVDRLYLRSGLSSWPCSAWMAKRNEARWRTPRHTAERPPLLTGEFTIARCSSFIERHSASRTSRNSRRTRGVRPHARGCTLERDLERVPSAGSTQTSTTRADYLGPRIARSSRVNHVDKPFKQNTRFRKEFDIF